MKSHSRKIMAAALCVAALLALAALASAEIAQKGTLRVSFNGQIAPVKLPRSEQAPVSVQMGGKIKTTDKSTPPRLERILLSINAHGVIQTKGLALCSLGKLNSVSAATAKKVCGEALIGHGNVTSRVSLPGQGAFASNGSLLAFNGKVNGRPAVLAQIESGPPLPLTYVIVFEVKKTKGTFGTELIGTLPPIASEYGYISAFNLSLGRSYAFHGEKLSYASASCPAPKGFPGASFPFAKASYEFAGGETLSSTLVRQCKVKN
ncbi:MAG: hypothetical protein H0X42_04235 [Solirubrobacterales bacterium]|nr:hypothetical protein [Solirubrobacterales bacterium]